MASVQTGFELFDHTADVGVRVVAPTLAELVPPAIAGFYSVLGDIRTAEPATPERFDFTGDDPALLLRDLLAELLRRFDESGVQFGGASARVFEPGRLVVDGALRPIDFDRSELETEVKAITYHQLEVRPIDGGFQATYIVDI
jgi:SHS2 domain-containing protein